MGSWIRVASLAELPQGSTLQVEAGGEAVCLYNVAGTICATHDTCTHAQASLSEGYLEGDRIECPLHQALFDVRSGKALTPPATEDLRVFAVRIEGDDISVLAD